MKPKIITLCGSARFQEQFLEKQKELTLQGHLVFTPAFLNRHEKICLTADDAKTLETVHRAKINLSHEIYVINVGGYLGNATRYEIEYASSMGIKINYLEVQE